MNSADRSIAIVDVAVRRRFAFLSLWPSFEVVEEHGCALGQRAYKELVSIFVEHAPDEALALVPGHSYCPGKGSGTGACESADESDTAARRVSGPGVCERIRRIDSGLHAVAGKLIMPRGRGKATRHRTHANSPLKAVRPTQEICLELPDYSRVTRSAVEFFGSGDSANPQAQAARLAEQFIQQNSPIFQLLQVEVHSDYDGADVLLNIESHGAVGAVPLRSPLTARHDFGLVVQPRFPWAGIGPMLAEMGWLISPSPLKLPLLKRSERRVPLWVLSFMVLARFKALLDRLDRRFEVTTETRPAPKGRIEWTQYATRQMPRGAFLSVPCTFPDLRDDRLLKSAIRFAVEKQLRSLETQCEQGAFVHRLIAFAESLLLRVRGISSRRPAAGELQTWLRRAMRTDVFLEGLQAID